MVEEKKGILNEDWLAFWMGMFLFALGMLNFVGVDALGWIVKTSVWTSLSKALAPMSKEVSISGFWSLVFTYLFMLGITTIGIGLLGGNTGRFMVGFTLVFWISFACWLLGHWAFIAATDAKKAGVPWSLKLTGEAGYIIALIVGLIFGNAVPQFGEKFKDAIRPEFYIKTAIVMLGVSLGLKAATAFGLATAIMFRGLCAIVEAYLIYWALVYWISRKYFKFGPEWAAPLASGISICGVSAAIATGGAIRARPVIPIMVSSLVVIFAVVELLILPFFSQIFLWKEPLVAGAWMGLAVKTDGAAVASGAVVDALIRAKAETAIGIKYAEGWMLLTATTVKVFIDLFIPIWAFILAYIWCAKIECKPGEKVQAREIWDRFPKFVMGYALTFLILLFVTYPSARALGPVNERGQVLKSEISHLENVLAKTPDMEKQAEISSQIAAKKEEINKLNESVKSEQSIVNKAKKAGDVTTGSLRKYFFLLTFFSIGVVSNFRKLWEEGIGRLAAVYVVCLFGFILWIGLFISWVFFHGVKPPIVSG